MVLYFIGKSRLL